MKNLVGLVHTMVEIDWNLEIDLPINTSKTPLCTIIPLRWVRSGSYTMPPFAFTSMQAFRACVG